MPRRRRESQSGGSMVVSVLSVMLFVALGVGVVYLRAQRRAEWREAQSGRSERGDGFVQPDPQPFQPPAPQFPVNPQPHQPHRPAPFVPAPPEPPQPKVLAPGLSNTEPTGGIFANIDYREYRQDGAILIGFDVGLGKVPDTAVVTYLRPIWLTAKGEQYGTAYGRTRNPIATVKARDGYAIGGVRIKGGGAIEGICFTFMRRGEKHLIADDFYISDWHGEQTRKPPAEDLRRGEGGFVIGIHGKRFDDKGGTEFNDSGCIGTIGLTLWVRE